MNPNKKATSEKNPNPVVREMDSTWFTWAAFLFLDHLVTLYKPVTIPVFVDTPQ